MKYESDLLNDIIKEKVISDGELRLALENAIYYSGKKPHISMYFLKQFLIWKGNSF